jgi:hypothetical protein
MEFDFAVFAALALVLGFKHAFDADHLVAVSSFLTRRPRAEDALGLATSWAGGHLLTAAAVSAAVYFFADTVLPHLLGRLELLVAVMLLAIGTLGLAMEYRRVHIHRHNHGDAGQTHAHLHLHGRSSRHEHGAMAGIGVVHGLASNDELLLVLLVGLAANSWWEMFAGVLIFSVGVMIGMAVYALAVHGLARRQARSPGLGWVPTAMTVAFSLLSIAYGAWLLAGGEGFNLVETWFGDRLPATE